MGLHTTCKAQGLPGLIFSDNGILNKLAGMDASCLGRMLLIQI